jgi:hypothetical protein
MWGIQKLLALEPVGDAIPEGDIIDQGLRMEVRFVRGSIARWNFCRMESGNVFFVDLENCQCVKN